MPNLEDSGTCEKLLPWWLLRTTCWREADRTFVCTHGLLRPFQELYQMIKSDKKMQPPATSKLYPPCVLSSSRSSLLTASPLTPVNTSSYQLCSDFSIPHVTPPRRNRRQWPAARFEEKPRDTVPPPLVFFRWYCAIRQLLAHSFAGLIAIMRVREKCDDEALVQHSRPRLLAFQSVSSSYPNRLLRIPPLDLRLPFARRPAPFFLIARFKTPTYLLSDCLLVPFPARLLLFPSFIVNFQSNIAVIILSKWLHVTPWSCCSRFCHSPLAKVLQTTVHERASPVTTAFSRCVTGHVGRLFKHKP